MGLFNFKKSKVVTINSPINGKAKSITETPDPVFSEKMMGDGITFEPKDGTMVAPVDGKVTLVFPSKHAVGLTLDNGCEILLHFGIETVSLEGVCFESFVEQGQTVKQGDLLLKADLTYIREHAPSDNLMMVFTSVPNNLSLEFNCGDVTPNDPVVKIS